MKKKEFQTHFMNYTYSYFAGIFAAMAVSFILGQNPIKRGLPVLIFLLVTYFVGLGACTFIYLCVHIRSNKKK